MFKDRFRRKILSYVSSEEWREESEWRCHWRMLGSACFVALLSVGFTFIAGFKICPKILSKGYDDKGLFWCVPVAGLPSVLLSLCACCCILGGYRKLLELADKEGRKVAKEEASVLMEEGRAANSYNAL